ncbi:acetamidase/formamidase family protein [Ekhidna sp.]|uniref:acetamidase/formamidase family protein n=1 Tax=Ekhidna sp. TaxID=2608089 RepID=UPI00351783D1
MKTIYKYMKQHFWILVVAVFGCTTVVNDSDEVVNDKILPEANYSLTSDQTHNKWSRSIEPVLTINSGEVVEISTEEATDGQLTLDSDTSDLMNLSFEPIHPLTGPIYINGAQPGDVIAVTLHKIEIGDWGWTAILPGFGFLADEFTEPHLKTFELAGKNNVRFADGINIPLKPFPGVLGVAPNTDSLLSTIPPRANGGNMDDPNIVEGTTVYLPVFVEGALFSIGDAHAAQGLGEVCGTAIEAPMKFLVEIEVLKGSSISEPQYENDDVYAVTAFATTIDEAAKKATRYMIDYLMSNHGLSRNDAYMLCSLAGDLKIAEVVDVPHMLVTMSISKEVL